MMKTFYERSDGNQAINSMISAVEDLGYLYFVF